VEKDVTSFIDDATNEKIDGKTFTGKLDDVAADIDGVMKPVYNYIEAQLNLGKLGYAELKLTDADVAIRLETNLINLPLQEIKRISKMISDEDKLPVNVYILMISPLVNASGLRIDEVSSGLLSILRPSKITWLKKLRRKKKRIRRPLLSELLKSRLHY
jgi:hypothetical protein